MRNWLSGQVHRTSRPRPGAARHEPLVEVARLRAHARAARQGAVGSGMAPGGRAQPRACGGLGQRRKSRAPACCCRHRLRKAAKPQLTCESFLSRGVQQIECVGRIDGCGERRVKRAQLNELVCWGLGRRGTGRGRLLSCGSVLAALHSGA